VSTEVLWRKDGTSFPVEYTSMPLYNHKNQVEGAVVTFRDISDRIKSEAVLRESEERFQAFMNHSPTVAFLKDTAGRYIYGNDAFQKLLNQGPLEYIGKTDMDLFSPQEACSFRQHDQEALKRGTVFAIEETSIDREGQLRYWWTMKFPVQSKSGEVLLGGVALDITLRKEAEDALREREQELQANQVVLQDLGRKLISAQEDERRRIARELHDDMNQRLAVLGFNLQSAQQGLAESAPMYQTLQKLYEGISSLSDDVRRLAYQLHPSILDDLGLEVALRSLVEDFSKWEGVPAVFAGTDVPVSLSQEIASCLYRVAQEALRNIAKHAEASRVTVKLAKEGEGLRLSIADNGKGFACEAKRVGKSGLGIMGMQERVRMVQGIYEVKSAPGQGTTITVRVPIGDMEREKLSEC
jgi:PAS domain S-box-containing protein